MTTVIISGVILILKSDSMETSALRKILLSLLLFVASALTAQETAARFFNKVSENYADIEAYTASFLLIQGSGEEKDEQEGKLTYKEPNKIRLDFTSPRDRVFSVNSTDLIIYIPKYRTAFKQALRADGGNGSDILTSEGLQLIKESYSISYLTGPDPVELDENSKEKVTKLLLKPFKSGELFWRMIISVSSDKMIRRVEVVTKDNEKIQLDIYDLDMDAVVSERYFDYEPPATASQIENFLFEPVAPGREE